MIKEFLKNTNWTLATIWFVFLYMLVESYRAPELERDYYSVEMVVSIIGISVIEKLEKIQHLLEKRSKS